MMTTSPDNATACHEISRTSLDLAVLLPECLHHELHATFPLVGVRSDTAENNLQLQRIAVLIIDRGLRDKDRLFSFNQKLLEEMTNRRQREDLRRFFDNPQRFRTVKGYVPGRNSKVRTVIGTPLLPVGVYQHNGSGPGVGPCAFLPVRWRFSGPRLVPFVISAGWRRSFHRSFVSASEKLWPGTMLFESLITGSLADLVIEDVGQDGFMDLAQRRSELVQRRSRKGQRRASPAEAASIYQQRWQHFRDNRFEDIIRKHSRCYYGLTNQPKDLRRENLKFRRNGQTVRTCEIDMSSTYPVCLATKCLSSRFGRTKSTDRFIQDIVSGELYAIVAKAAGPKYASLSHDKKKKKFSIECFFDKEPRFGHSPMFRAFDRLYPDAARLVMSIRNKPLGARCLSNMLNEIEGGFFIDIVLPELHKLKIPCLPIHDAVMVPSPDCERAFACIKGLLSGYFGFEPMFKVTAAVC